MHVSLEANKLKTCLILKIFNVTKEHLMNDNLKKDQNPDEVRRVKLSMTYVDGVVTLTNYM